MTGKCPRRPHDDQRSHFFRSGNCSVERIPLTSPDSELVEASHVRLKHAKELLDVDPTQFMYSGEVSPILSPSFADLILFIEVPTNFPSKVAFICGPSNVIHYS